MGDRAVVVVPRAVVDALGRRRRGDLWGRWKGSGRDEGILEYTAANCGHHTGLWTDELNQSPRILVCAVRYCDLVKSGTAFHNPPFNTSVTDDFLFSSHFVIPRRPRRDDETQFYKPCARVARHRHRSDFSIHDVTKSREVARGSITPQPQIAQIAKLA